MYFSKSKNSFYDEELLADYRAAGTWPNDAVEITDSHYNSVMADHAKGYAIQSDANGQPVAVAPSLGNQQVAAWNNIKAKRDDVTNNAGVEIAISTGVNKWFQTDANSRVQFLGLKDTARDMLAAGHVMSDALQLNGQPVNWKTYDNSFVPLTIQNVFDIVAAVKTLDAVAFANAETHREKMLQVADPLAYDYSTGWPAIYEE